MGWMFAASAFRSGRDLYGNLVLTGSSTHAHNTTVDAHLHIWHTGNGLQ